MTEADIIGLLFARSEEALVEIATKYGSLYRSIIKNILENESDVAECENDVLLAIWNSIPPNKPQHLGAYVSRIARNVSINRFKANTRTKRNGGFVSTIDELAECIPEHFSKDLIKREDNKAISQAINSFLKECEPQTRVLFIRRYFFMESLESVAKRFGISKNQASVKLFRARNRLKELLEKEEIEL